MPEITLKLTDMAHGGAALGRDSNGRTVFVNFAIPGETVRARLTQQKDRFARAVTTEVLQPSPHRVQPHCPHFGVCGSCHFQHMDYAHQLEVKQTVARDQLQRIGGLKRPKVHATLPNPSPWAYANQIALSPVEGGGLGLWSAVEQRIIPIETCHIIHADLLALLQDIDLSLPDLRKLTLRLGSDGEMLAALEVEDVEPPELEVDFPVSVAIVLPDNTAASLIGDHYLVQTVKARDFRVSPGCFFQPNLEGAAQIVDTVLSYANLRDTQTVLELYGGVGMLTAFLAEAADAVATVEVNPDAVADMASNLADTDNVTVLEGFAEDILPELDVNPDVMVVDPGADGLTREVIGSLRALRPSRLIYVSSEIATLARDSKQLTRSGFRLVEVQPIDVMPQTYQIDTVSLWQRK